MRSSVETADEYGISVSMQAEHNRVRQNQGIVPVCRKSGYRALQEASVLILINMFPVSAMNDELNGSFANSKETSNLIHGNDAWGIHLSDLNNLDLLKFCWTSLLSSLGIKSSLPHAVSHVISMGSCKQMIRVTTCRIIAVVANLITFGKNSTGINPCHSVCKFFSVTCWPWPFPCRNWRKYSVTFLAKMSKPIPAGILGRFIDFSPESNRGFGFGNHSQVVT